MLTAIPIEPMIINGLRPNLSTVRIARTVKTRFTIPTIIFFNKDESEKILNTSGFQAPIAKMKKATAAIRSPFFSSQIF